MNNPAHGIGSRIPHKFSNSFQNTNSPDINFERDLIGPESEISLGMEVGELEAQKGFIINISTILISALLFLMILAWFDFMQTTFYSWLSPETQDEFVSSAVKLWYALLVTMVVVILVILIYYHSNH